MASPILQEGPLPLGFTEYKDSGQEDYNFRDGKVEFIRIFDGPWDKRNEFIFNHILPSITEAEGEIFFNAPNFYPAYPSARPYRATVKGLLKTDKDADNFIKHTLARVTVYYALPEISDDGGGGGNDDPNDPDDPERLYVVENVDTETEIIPLVARKFEYVYNTAGIVIDSEGMLVNSEFIKRKATEDGKINHLIKRINYKLTLPYIINPRWNWITFLAGKVNTQFFLTPSGLLAAPGQLRYDGISSITKREISLGALAWEMQHSFCHYRPGWNTHPTTIPDPDDGTITKLIHAAINPPLFKAGVLQQIFLDLPTNLINSWANIFDSLTVEEKRGFYDDSIAPLSSQAIAVLKQLMPALNIWR